MFQAGVVVAAMLLVHAIGLPAQAPITPPVRLTAPAALDARPAFRPRTPSEPSPAQLAALDDWRRRLPDLRAQMDELTGATRSLWNIGGYLTEPDSRDAEVIAVDFITANVILLGLVPADIADIEMTDRVHSANSGVTHIYYRQRLGAIPVYNAQLHVNVAVDGRVLSVNNRFVPHLAEAVRATRPALAADAAVGFVAGLHGLTNVRPVVSHSFDSARRTTVLEADGLSEEPVQAELVIVPVSAGAARLSWNFQVHTPGRGHAFDYTVDAESGLVWTRVDWVATDQYRVYPMPVESPIHASPAPPADARGLVVNPAHNVASPFGWHDTNGVAGAEYTITRGNNVYAYADVNNDNVPDSGSAPDCGPSLDCSFPIALEQQPQAYQAASVANLFYWANLVHDVQHRYGFDEAAGNFQENNYGRGGLGGDALRAEAQDSLAREGNVLNRNNANFYTPPDGEAPRMQMYGWTYTSPMRDGGLDAGIVVHEYGHGVSNRLVGGPSNVNCLANRQQPGEGISDWLALVFTARASDTPAQGRGLGTYGLGQGSDGTGIRTRRYSTDPAVNPWTYESIGDPDLSEPHGVGSVWAQGMWKVYWALVNEHGFSPNLHAANDGFGNQRALLYHTEGLKNTACSPTFTDLRDGIIQAAQTLHGGADVCRLWDAFATFGLGLDAVSGGPDSRAVVNGFNKPVACGGVPIPSVSISGTSVPEGDTGMTNAVLTVSLTNATPTPVTVNYRTLNGTAVSDVLGASRSNGQAITIPEGELPTPSPSVVTVPDGAGTVQAVAVTLHGLRHDYPEDLDILLEGPGGQTVLLMSDVGGAMPMAAPVTLTFRDDGATRVPSTHLPSGSYRPTNVDAGDVFPAPAPAGPHGATFAPFVGQPASGSWRLFVMDDMPGDAGGAIAGGWTLHLGTAGNDFVASGGLITIPPGTTEAQITVPVIGDVLPEGPENFRVQLHSPTGAVIGTAEAVVTIVDDDDPEQLPEPPTAVRVASVSGNTVTLTWLPPAGGAPPTGYVIEGGVAPGQVLASIPSGSAAPGLTFAAPSGSFYVRVHTLWGNFRSGPSNEIVLHVNAPLPPATPGPLLATVDGSSVALAWRPSYDAGAPSSFVLDVSGALAASLPLGAGERALFHNVPSGTYTLQLRAVNGAGTSAPTAPVTVTLPDACTGVPHEVSDLQVFNVGRTVHVRWAMPPAGAAPTAYELQVSGPFSGTFATAARGMSGTVPPGDYAVSVAATNMCGRGTSSTPRTLSVP